MFPACSARKKDGSRRNESVILPGIEIWRRRVRRASSSASPARENSNLGCGHIQVPYLLVEIKRQGANGMIAQWKPILLPDLFTKQGIDTPEHSGFFQGGAVSFNVCGTPEHAGEAVEFPASVQA